MALNLSSGLSPWINIHGGIVKMKVQLAGKSRLSYDRLMSIADKGRHPRTRQMSHVPGNYTVLQLTLAWTLPYTSMKPEGENRDRVQGQCN